MKQKCEKLNKNGGCMKRKTFLMLAAGVLLLSILGALIIDAVFYSGVKSLSSGMFTGAAVISVYWFMEMMHRNRGGKHG